MFERFFKVAPLLLTGAMFVFPAVPAFGQDEVSPTMAGSAVFKTYCAVCHGKEAKGDGPLAGSLRFTPSNLTLLAQRNGGTYPAEQVFRMIDGRKPLRGHGGPDMPVWGDAFKGTADGYSEEKVKTRIDGLVGFLKTIQVETK